MPYNQTKANELNGEKKKENNERYLNPNIHNLRN